MRSTTILVAIVLLTGVFLSPPTSLASDHLQVSFTSSGIADGPLISLMGKDLYSFSASDWLGLCQTGMTTIRGGNSYALRLFSMGSQMGICRQSWFEAAWSEDLLELAEALLQGQDVPGPNLQLGVYYESLVCDRLNAIKSVQLRRRLKLETDLSILAARKYVLVEESGLSYYSTPEQIEFYLQYDSVTATKGLGAALGLKVDYRLPSLASITLKLENILSAIRFPEATFKTGLIHSDTETTGSDGYPSHVGLLRGKTNTRPHFLRLEPKGSIHFSSRQGWDLFVSGKRSGLDRVELGIASPAYGRISVGKVFTAETWSLGWKQERFSVHIALDSLNLDRANVLALSASFTL